jgi:hypothetical protein
MLSWSSHASEAEIDLAAVAEGRGEAGIPLSEQLLEFASAAADLRGGGAELELARNALVAAADAATMFDAAAVAANFQMMTRLADGTGARYPAGRLADMTATIDEMSAGSMTSRR